MVSFRIASPWTTVGTVRVGLMGIALNMDLSPAITARAVISGAYLGDTTSPLFDSGAAMTVKNNATNGSHAVFTIFSAGRTIDSPRATVVALATLALLSGCKRAAEPPPRRCGRCA